MATWRGTKLIPALFVLSFSFGIPWNATVRTPICVHWCVGVWRVNPSACPRPWSSIRDRYIPLTTTQSWAPGQGESSFIEIYANGRASYQASAIQVGFAGVPAWNCLPGFAGTWPGIMGPLLNIPAGEALCGFRTRRTTLLPCHLPCLT